MDPGDATAINLQVHRMWHDDDFFVSLYRENLARPAGNTRDREDYTKDRDVVTGDEAGKTERTSECENEWPRSRRRKEHDSRRDLAVLCIVGHSSTISRSNKRQ